MLHVTGDGRIEYLAGEFRARTERLGLVDGRLYSLRLAVSAQGKLMAWLDGRQVLDHEEGVLGQMKRADEKFFENAAQAEVSVGADDIKVVFDCPVPTGMETAKRRDAWSGDRVEFYLRPSTGSRAFFCIAAGASGVWEAHAFKAPGSRDYSPGMSENWLVGKRSMPRGKCRYTTGTRSKSVWKPVEEPSDMKRVRLTALAEFAGIHSRHYGHYRMPVPHFPFSIYYDVEGNDVIVKAVLDDRFGPARIAAHFGS